MVIRVKNMYFNEKGMIFMTKEEFKKYLEEEFEKAEVIPKSNK